MDSLSVNTAQRVHRLVVEFAGYELANPVREDMVVKPAVRDAFWPDQLAFRERGEESAEVCVQKEAGKPSVAIWLSLWRKPL